MPQKNFLSDTYHLLQQTMSNKPILFIGNRYYLYINLFFLIICHLIVSCTVRLLRYCKNWHDLAFRKKKFVSFLTFFSQKNYFLSNIFCGLALFAKYRVDLDRNPDSPEDGILKPEKLVRLVQMSWNFRKMKISIISITL